MREYSIYRIFLNESNNILLKSENINKFIFLRKGLELHSFWDGRSI